MAKFSLRLLLTAIVVLSVVCGHIAPALAQASQIPPGKQCFQATTGINGMIGSFGLLTGGTGGITGSYTTNLIGGSGSGASALIAVSGGAVIQITLLNPGVNFVAGDFVSAPSVNIGGVTGFQVLVASTAINSSLSGGAVGMYIPGTLTAKQTWMDAAETQLNGNPVQLDLNGCALMYGVGIYRQIVYDRLGNTIWDQPTTAFTTNPVYAGLAGGTGNAITVTDTAFAGIDGQAITFLAANNNSGATTLNPSGFGAIAVVKNGSSGPVPLAGGEIIGATPGNIYTAVYSAIYHEFFIGNPLSTGGGSTPVPSGAVMPFALTSCPTGWVNANGTGGTVNMLGAVARGYDPTNTRDPNGSAQSVGSFETPMFLTHTMLSLTGTGFLTFVGSGGSVVTGSGSNNVATASTTGSPSTGAGNETRAASTILLYCQKS